MPFSPDIQQQLETLLEHFVAPKSEAGTLAVAPPDSLIVVRADGIKASKP